MVCPCNPLCLLVMKVYTVKKTVGNSSDLLGLNFAQNLVNHCLIPFSAIEIQPKAKCLSCPKTYLFLEGRGFSGTEGCVIWVRLKTIFLENEFCHGKSSISGFWFCFSLYSAAIQ